MQPRNVWCALVLAAALAGSGTAWRSSAEPSIREHQWATYHDARFGTTADYPADLFTVRAWPPTNGDGQIFRTADGQRAAHDLRHAQFRRGLAEFLRREVFQQAGSDLQAHQVAVFVVSGVRDGEIFYTRCNFPIIINSIIDCFELRYPAKDKAKWDAIVTRISNSLRAGKGAMRRE